MQESQATRGFLGFLKCVAKMVLGVVTGFGRVDNIIDIIDGLGELIDRWNMYFVVIHSYGGWDKWNIILWFVC